jgi:hypothetical protein
MLTDDAEQILRHEWDEVRKLGEAGKLKDRLDDSRLLKAIRLSINSPIKTYRYVLPTQLVSKLADTSLDSRCIQSLRGGPGAFDARTVAHSVIVPFDQKNENVLGGSQEPYVNNPLRVPEVSSRYRDAQRDKKGWDRLCVVLKAVESANDENFTKQVFKQVLAEIYKRLSGVRVSYPVPRRVSLKRTMEAIEAFLAEHSGGDRLLALSSALFTVIGQRFGLYVEVRRGKIAAADQASGMLADLECVSKDGQLAFAVEVKDRQITISQLRAKLRTIRERQVSEIFFVAQGTIPSEKGEVEALVDREFTSGQNLYITDLVRLSRTTLALLGEKGRRAFLAETANQLEKYHSEVVHRKAWASVLAAL